MWAEQEGAREQTHAWVELALIVVTAVLFGMSAYKNDSMGPGRLVHVVRALSRCTRVVSSSPGQGTYKNQPVSA